MTSSLVGSEMCIRDRARVNHTPRARLLPARRSSGSSLPAELMHVYLPVSYTHLTLPTICSV
eukprot:10293205-Prorocentrum_lima.AAC.1